MKERPEPFLLIVHACNRATSSLDAGFGVIITGRDLRRAGIPALGLFTVMKTGLHVNQHMNTSFFWILSQVNGTYLNVDREVYRYLR